MDKNNSKSPLVGILSLNMYTTDLNFATRIHTYAFQSFLNNNGIDNVVVDYIPQHCDPDFNMRHPYDYYVENPVSDEVEQGKRERKWKKLYKERESKADKYDRFVQKYYRKTPECYTVDDLDTSDPGCDIYVCATDVLWKYRDNTAFDKGFFLKSKCMDGKGKIVYSVSYGGKPYTSAQIEEITKLTEGIDYLSTREKYLYALLTEKLNRTADITLDPVFLMDSEFYRGLEIKPEKKDYVLVYTVMKNSRKVVKAAVEYGQKFGYDVIELSSYYENETFPAGTNHTVIYDVGVEEVLGYIDNAKCVFTNSFHACCFSVIFNTQFFVGERGGTKIPWLLEVFNLQNRWFNEGENDKFDTVIDYAPVNYMIEKYRKISGDWIIGAIKNVDKKLKNEGGPERLYALAPIKYNSYFRKTDIIYSSGSGCSEDVQRYIDAGMMRGKLKKTGNDSYEYRETVNNSDREYKLLRNIYKKSLFKFTGWNLKYRHSKMDTWKWYCDDGVWIEESDLSGHIKYVFREGETVRTDIFPADRAVFVAVWKSGIKNIAKKMGLK